MSFEARTAAFPSSFMNMGSKSEKPHNLKKFGSATTPPRVEPSIVWTSTLRSLNSLDLAESRLEYFFNLYSLECCILVSWHTVNSPITIDVDDTIARSGLGPLNRSQTCLAPGTLRSQKRDWFDFIFGTIHFAIISKMVLYRFVYRARAPGELQLDKTCLFV